MIYPDDEVAAGMERLGRYPEARYLRQLLLREMMSVSGSNQKSGAVRMQEGRRSFASELIEKLKPEPNAKHDGPDAAELIRGPERRESSDTGSRRAARRLAAEE